VEKFRDVLLASGAFPQRRAKLLHAAGAIVAKYLADGAPAEINIKHSTKEAALQIFARACSDVAGTFPSSIFDGVQHEVTMLLAAEPLRRFLQSRAFKDLARADVPLPFKGVTLG
jgi:hypothetical protein